MILYSANIANICVCVCVFFFRAAASNKTFQLSETRPYIRIISYLWRIYIHFAEDNLHISA